jgi:CHASE2 domain-containing sensor protein
MVGFLEGEQIKMKLFSSITILIKSRLTSYILYILSCGLVFCLLQFPSVHGLIEATESFIYTQIFTSTAHPSENLIIIDEEDNIYDRAVYAQLINGLNRLGAKVIAMDVLFEGEKNPIEDKLLVTATEEASDKLIHAIEFLRNNNQAIIPDRFHSKTSNRILSDRFIEGVNGAVLPFNDLLKVTTYLGHVCAYSDIARRNEKYFPLIIYYNNRIYPSLPLLAVMKFFNNQVDSVLSFDNNNIKLETNSKFLHIPIDNSTQTLINFISLSKFSGKIFSIEKAFECIRMNMKLFQDKIILIGNTWDSLEQTYGPHNKKYPNLFIFGSLISQILNDENIREGVLESFIVSFVLLTLYIMGLLSSPGKFKQFKFWQISLCSFFILLIFAIISINIKIRTYIILPWIIFCFACILSAKIIAFNIFKPKHVESIKKVFISYSHKDSEFVSKLNSSLKEKEIKINIDIETLKFGHDIKKFMEKSIQESDFVISVVSKNSLMSPWVIAESLETLIIERIEKKKMFLPIYIDKSFMEKSFQSKIYNKIKIRIDVLLSEINDLSINHIKTIHLDKEKDMLIDLENNLAQILAKLNEILVTDFSSEEKINENLPKLIKQIDET